MDEMNSIPSDKDTFKSSSALFNKLNETQLQTIKDTKTVPPHLCCSDPYWIFRIYHDTIVDVNAIITLVTDAFNSSKKTHTPYIENERHWQETGIIPKPIYSVTQFPWQTLMCIGDLS